MLKKYIKKAFGSKLSFKIWIYMIIPVIVVFILIDTAFNIYYNNYTLKKALNASASETSYAAENFSKIYSNILQSFIHIAVSDEFKSQVPYMLGSDSKNYIDINNRLQNTLSDLGMMNGLIKSALIAKAGTKPKLLFYPYSGILSQDVSYNLGLDLRKINGITVFPHAKSPFVNQPEVIPIAIPLNYDEASRLVLISNNSDNADLIVYLLLGTSEVGNYIKSYCKDIYQGTLYLANSNGQNLSLASNAAGFQTAENTALAELLSLKASGGQKHFTWEGNHVYLYQINDSGLYLVNVIPHEKFTVKSDDVHKALLWIATISIAIITLLSRMISVFVTNPLKKLMISVRAIETNSYSGKADIKSNDEIGELNNYIDSMYKTIQQQILIIKHEEKEKYNAKLQLLAEQINPHFLYNALEFVNMEIFNGDVENASSMILNLSEYLRISLAYGENMHSISRELDLAFAYIKIMNLRFNNSIQLTTQVPEDLLNHTILKCIVQPLIENSIKHGFKLGNSRKQLFFPVIEISMSLDDEHFTLSVTDNGAGFDPNKMSELMFGEQKEAQNGKHFGLNNIYQRLLTYYGDVSVSFSSIPFVENKIVIKLPPFKN